MLAKTRTNRFILYLLILVVTALITIASLKIRLLGEGLTGTLYTLVITIAALFGDYLAGILAIAFSAVGLNYLVAHNDGFHLSHLVVFKTVELLVSGVLICSFVWWVRNLRQDNLGLLKAAQELEDIVSKLRRETKGNKQRLAKLNSVNQELESLVKGFLEDDEYWNNRWGPR